MTAVNNFTLFDHVKLNDPNPSTFIKNFEKIDAFFSISGVTHTVTVLREGTDIEKGETLASWQEVSLKIAALTLSIILIIPIMMIMITKALYQYEISKVMTAPLPPHYHLFQRTPWVAHVRNQYQHLDGADRESAPLTRAACAGIAVESVYQLLQNPNAFLEGREIFERLLNNGVENCHRALVALNQGIEQELPAIYEQLKQVFIDRGTLAMLQMARQTYHGHIDQSEVTAYFTAELSPLIQNGTITGRENIANHLSEHLFQRIDFMQPEGSFLNIDEGLQPIADEKMNRIGQGPIEDYRLFFEALEAHVLKQQAPVGAIVHIQGIIFAVCMNTDGKIMMADSHGFRFIKKPDTNECPFAFLIASNIDDAVTLMKLHKPHQEEVANQSASYFYTLYPNAEQTPLDPTLFGTDHCNL